MKEALLQNARDLKNDFVKSAEGHWTCDERRDQTQHDEAVLKKELVDENPTERHAVQPRKAIFQSM